MCGFGFVTIIPRCPLDKITRQNFKLGGIRVDVRLALEKDEAKAKNIEESSRKLFVGSLPRNLSDSSLHSYFSKFGDIQKAYVVRNIDDGHTRGFGFVIFDDEESVYKTLSKKTHVLLHHQIYPKYVVPKYPINNYPQRAETRNSHFIQDIPPAKTYHSSFGSITSNQMEEKDQNYLQVGCKRKGNNWISFQSLKYEELPHHPSKSYCKALNLASRKKYGPLTKDLDQRYSDIADYFYTSSDALSSRSLDSECEVWSDTPISTYKELCYYADNQGLFGLLRATIGRQFMKIEDPPQPLNYRC